MHAPSLLGAAVALSLIPLISLRGCGGSSSSDRAAAARRVAAADSTPAPAAGDTAISGAYELWACDAEDIRCAAGGFFVTQYWGTHGYLVLMDRDIAMDIFPKNQREMAGYVLSSGANACYAMEQHPDSSRRTLIGHSPVGIVGWWRDSADGGRRIGVSLMNGIEGGGHSIRATVVGGRLVGVGQLSPGLPPAGYENDESYRPRPPEVYEVERVYGRRLGAADPTYCRGFPAAIAAYERRRDEAMRWDDSVDAASASASRR